jgi:hypothetical protein
LAIGLYQNEENTRMKRHGMSDRDREIIGAWLGSMALPIGGWKLFHTATFAPETPARSEWIAMDRYRRYMHERDRRKITWVAAVEPNPDHHRLCPGFHVHAMWAELAAITYAPGHERWDGQWGNNRFSSVQSAGNVADYLAKYCVKQNCMIDWEINGALWHLTEARAA